MSELAAAGIAAGASVANSGINLLFNERYQRQQKELLANQYDEFIKQSQRVGATPSAIAAGLTGAGASSTPSVSAPNQTSDIGANAASIYGAYNDAKLKESERDINRMRLLFEPKKYFADIQKTFSDVYRNYSEGKYFKALKSYYGELEDSLVQKRPWEIMSLKGGLVKILAEYDKILQDTKTSKALESKYYQDVQTGKSQAGYYDAAAENQWSESMNKNLESFKIMFENQLRAAGWNPSDNLWGNVSRLSVTNPPAFKEFMDNTVNTLNVLDDKLQENLGEHYKRNAVIGAGLARYLLNTQNRRNGRNHRINNTLRTAISIIPFTHPGSSVVPSSTAGVDWWLKD